MSESGHSAPSTSKDEGRQAQPQHAVDARQESSARQIEPTQGVPCERVGAAGPTREKIVHQVRSESIPLQHDDGRLIGGDCRIKDSVE